MRKLAVFTFASRRVAVIALLFVAMAGSAQYSPPSSSSQVTGSFGDVLIIGSGGKISDSGTNITGLMLGGSNILSSTGGIRTTGSRGAITGCSTTSPTSSGPSAGAFLSGTAGTCSVTIAIGSLTASNGWSCWGYDLTSQLSTGISNPAIITARTKTSISFQLQTTSGDEVDWGCLGF